MLNLSRLTKAAEDDLGRLSWVQSINKASQSIDSSLSDNATFADTSALLTHWSSSANNQLLNFSAPKQNHKSLQLQLLQVPIEQFQTSRLKSSRFDNWIDFTFMDLFAGIGGFHLAMSSQGGTLAFASESDTSARITYAMNYGIVPFGDIRTFTRHANGQPLSVQEIAKRVPRSDIITAGFPCQPFSQAGVSSRNFHGLDHGLRCEAQGTLFEDILLIARATRPDAIVLENVRNLASHDKGKTIRIIRNEIEHSGYQIFPDWTESRNWAVVDSRAVVAQRRKRVYMVCIRKDLSLALERKKGSFQMPTFENPKKPFTLRDIIEEDNELSNDEKFNRFSISPLLWQSHQRRDANHESKNNGFRAALMTDLNQPAPTLVARYYKDGKDCLIPNTTTNGPPRMLTPTECGLLQTFPKNFWIPKAKTPAYKQFGNSITVEVARRIAQQLTVYLYT